MGSSLCSLPAHPLLRIVFLQKAGTGKSSIPPEDRSVSSCQMRLLPFTAQPPFRFKAVFSCGRWVCNGVQVALPLKRCLPNNTLNSKLNCLNCRAERWPEFLRVLSSPSAVVDVNVVSQPLLMSRGTGAILPRVVQEGNWLVWCVWSGGMMSVAEKEGASLWPQIPCPVLPAVPAPCLP